MCAKQQTENQPPPEITTKPTYNPKLTIKQILDILDVLSVPQVAINKIRRLCWQLVDNTAVQDE